MDIFYPLNDLAKARHTTDNLVQSPLTRGGVRFANEVISPSDSGATGSGLDMVERKTAEQDINRAAVETLLTALVPFRRANPTMTLQQLVSFLLVARKEGKQVTHYANEAGLAQGVMTRNLFDLGEFNRKREPGLGLLEQRPDIMDRRSHLTYLTAKGLGVIGDVRRALEGFCRHM